MRRLANIFWLGTKELRSFLRDGVLLAFVIYSFSLAIYSQATGISHELRNVAVAIVDEDHSQLSQAIGSALLPPYFKAPQYIDPADMSARIEGGRYTFILDIPPRFQADVLAGRNPALQVAVDATAMMQAGIGAGYIQEIASTEIYRFVHGPNASESAPVPLEVRVAFNPTMNTGWFVGVMGLINHITMLAVILAGAAVIREREHGTMDHLLVMPLTAFEIVAAKVWANALVIAVATCFALIVVIHGVLGLPSRGLDALFMAGVLLYLFFATAVGVFLGTVARSMPQLGLLFILTVLPMNMLSGSNTPLESMPEGLQVAMQLVPSTHFVKIAQATLYRGAGLDIIWPNLLIVGLIGAGFLALALFRFRAVSSQQA